MSKLTTFTKHHFLKDKHYIKYNNTSNSNNINDKKRIYKYRTYALIESEIINIFFTVLFRFYKNLKSFTQNIINILSYK